VVSGFSSSSAANSHDQNNYYAGLTLATPVAGLKVGLAYDYARNVAGTDDSILGVYASFQATPKLSLHGRAEYVNNGTSGGVKEGSAYTLTAQYDLWQNVISRLEGRYDLVSDQSSTRNNVLTVYANIIYKF